MSAVDHVRFAAATTANPPAKLSIPKKTTLSPVNSPYGNDPAKGKDDSIPRSIFEAAERGDLSFIIRTVERNIEFDINQTDKFQRTALHWAAEMNQLKCAEALIDFGCKATTTECNGRTPFHLAARNGHVEMLQLLMENATNEEKEVYANQADIHGLTPVYLALLKGEETRGAFEFLMECGGRYNSSSSRFKNDPAVAPDKQQAA